MNPRVLSIQSHVVRGYVGNKSATFPLQVLGFEVDGINSVQLSNHTGYRVTKGQVLDEKDLEDLVEGLKENGLSRYSHLLTGYVGSPSFLHGVVNVVNSLRAVNNDLVYVCDPVLGDDGEMYVPESLLPVYREKIVPLADILTPNQYELELLSERSVKSLGDAWEAVDALHRRGSRTVIVSSTNLGSRGRLAALASGFRGGEKIRAVAEFPKLDASFTGTGDLFAALFLAWMSRTENDLETSLDNTVETLQCVLRRTLASVPEGEEKTVERLELRLIQSKADIENPRPIESYTRRLPNA